MITAPGVFSAEEAGFLADVGPKSGPDNKARLVGPVKALVHCAGQCKPADAIRHCDPIQILLMEDENVSNSASSQHHSEGVLTFQT